MSRTTAFLAVLSAMALAWPLPAQAFAQDAPPLARSQAKLGAPSAPLHSAPHADPGNLFNYGGSIGQTLRFTVVGGTQGGIWGDGVYTSDSVLAVAVVHAGLLASGEAGIVSVEIVPGQASYAGSSRNGVESMAYGAWNLGYRITKVEAIDGPVPLPDPGTLQAYRGQNGLVMHFEITGAASGSVWGDEVYTDDSALAAAAVHAGLLAEGQTGVVSIEIMPGQESYAGAERNGLASGSYGAWSGSFRFLPALGAKVAGKLAN